MHGGPADGYRTRARMHLRDAAGRASSKRARTSCATSPASRQLRRRASTAIARLAAALVSAAPGVEAEIEWAEDVAGTTRVVHVTRGQRPRRRRGHGAGPVAGLDGLSCVGGGRTLGTVAGRCGV